MGNESGPSDPNEEQLLPEEIQQAFIESFSPLAFDPEHPEFRNRNDRWLQQHTKDLESEVAGLLVELQELEEDQAGNPDEVRAGRIDEIKRSLLTANFDLDKFRRLSKDYKLR